MDIQNTVKNLHPLEVRIIRQYKRGDELSIEKVEAELQFKPGNGNQALSWLLGKGLIQEIRREPLVFFELTELGELWAREGTPEERILRLLAQEGALTMGELAQRLKLENKDVGSAYGLLSKANLVVMDEQKRVCLAPGCSLGADGLPTAGPGSQRLRLIRGLLERALKLREGTGKGEDSSGLLKEESLSPEERELMKSIAKKRGAADSAFRIVEREKVIYTFTEQWQAVSQALQEAGITGDEIGALTPELLASGAWKNGRFRSYNIQVPPTRLLVGRSNPYARFLEDVKDKLVSLGFEEFDGSLVETEFWNSDALFMPQFHSARDIHDVYYVAEPQKAQYIEEPWLSRVAAAHENGGDTGSRGWRYTFDREFTRRLILRSQGTVLSARQLPKAKIPGKYFGIVRCFRYDRVDATHLSDFYQTEGIVLGEDVNLRTLLGMLEMFATEVAGAKEVKYVPGYFPFTEPSVEVHIKHPVLGWFELGGSGIFRPEVTQSLGVNVPVAAWGIGIDRMALMALGLNDLRELFSYDIEAVRLRRTKESL
ncbi:MAG TPA: phenylalanine--tRNA ligase subunit alpha [Termitinemataceae bacterium]|nr:phenylalanine--tRNA ligase subunit alpha [Termitinemataceae bacterium]HOM24280.1 phenylalanine--tRNA ligase subunit alpha [Termitinemataceae bacterium]HPQ01401.1 phenylalanine--tRNA ligase subunit alpha [Termitinemataceae bacterium]